MTDEFNFNDSVNKAWKKFSVRLADVLSMMDETEAFVLRSSQGEEAQPYVTFTCDSPGTITALIEDEVLSQLPQSRDEKLWNNQGWKKATTGYVCQESQEQTQRLAVASVEVLREVFSLEHPVFLHSNVLEDVLTEPVVHEGLHGEEVLAQSYAAITYGSSAELASAVAEELSEIFGQPPLKDHDGDFAVRAGSTMIFIRLPDDGLEIRIFSVVVHDIAGRSRAAEVLNDINAHSRWVRFSMVRDKIIAVLSIYAVPFVPEHLRFAIEEMVKVADGVDDLLATSLQGKTTFPDQGETLEEDPEPRSLT
ncbi:MAG: YbjN domain-containing protein [Propionibacteriaceae bacterium]|nr:YbjN domain-containing protein [Propionibacteriaceae bacterium]